MIRSWPCRSLAAIASRQPGGTVAAPWQLHGRSLATGQPQQWSQQLAAAISILQRAGQRRLVATAVEISDAEITQGA